MARIPEEEIERIKREVDLVELVRASGVVLKRHGADLMGLCPMHDDRKPSLVVSPTKGLWHCLGACGTGGTVIDWVMKREGVSFREAVERLRAGAPQADAAAAAAPVPRLEPEPEDGALLGQVVDYYHRALREDWDGWAYLERRGLGTAELVERFRLGLSNRTLGYRLPPKSRKAGAEVRGRLQRLGILRESGHEHFNGSLVIPVFGADGEVVQMYGRKIRADLREGTPLHLYLPGPHRGVWNREGVEREVILCESLIDALTFWSAGLTSVTASYGVNGFTAEHLEVFRARGVKRVLIAYDADRAGDQGAAALTPELVAAGMDVWRVQFPRELDANSYARAAHPPTESLPRLIEQAVFVAGAGEQIAIGGAAVPGLEQSASPPPAAAAAPAPTPPPASEPAAFPSLAASVEPSPAPAPAASTSAAGVSGAVVAVRPEEVEIAVGDRRYRVRGLAKNSTPDALRINLMARRGEALHVDTLDLYAAKQRGAFAGAAARELAVKEELIRKDLGSVLLELEAIQAARLGEARESRPETPELTEAERAEALALLTAPDLLSRILEGFDACGVVGEETNKLLGYVAATSRKLERPLAVIVQSASAAGKTSLMDAVLAFVPEEERIQYSALTGQSLFYMEGMNLRHKVLAIAEEEGAEKASYALKLLQSEGELRIASTGKDPETGRLVTHEYRVEGPVMIFLTTTAVEVDEELLNRAVLLTVDEDREQTRAIHRAQRERRTLEGLLAREAKTDVLRLHQNAQRLLRPLAVVNPYAPRLTFLDSRTRTRRDHEKYLTLIDAIALLHQHQREVKRIERGGRAVEYVEATLSDIEAANRLADAVLGRSLDELPPQTRRFLDALHAWVSARPREEREGEPEPVRFTARAVREALGVGGTQTKLHLSRLVDLEYLVAHRGPNGQYLYELLYEGQGQDGGTFLVGLLDVAALRCEYDPPRSAPEGERSEPEAARSGGGRPLDGPRPGGGRSAPNGRKPASSNGLAHPAAESLEIALIGAENGAGRSVPAAGAAA
jgi:DNA primase